MEKRKDWLQIGIQNVYRVCVFRQGGDEFSIIVHGYFGKEKTQEKLYSLLKKQINEIMIENSDKMDHITVSVGVCDGYRINNDEEWLKKADEAAEIVKNNGRDGFRLYYKHTKQIYSTFLNHPT
eukprot:142299_1